MSRKTFSLDSMNLNQKQGQQDTTHITDMQIKEFIPSTQLPYNWAIAAAAALKSDCRQEADPTDPILKNNEPKSHFSLWQQRKAKNSTCTIPPKLHTKTLDYSIQNYWT
jgi:hypothetical protein